MNRHVRALGPAVVVPFAWAVVVLAHVDVLADRAMLAVHVVLALAIGGTLARYWDEMEIGLVRVWRDVLSVGVVLSIGGIVGLLVLPVRTAFLTTTLLGWMIVPAIGLFYTGTRLPVHSWVYKAGAVLSVAGAVVYAGALFPAETSLLVAGILLATVGQLTGLATAAYEFTRRVST